MFDKEIVRALLCGIEEAIMLIDSQSARISSPADFVTSQDGVFLMGGVCMQLIQIGESVKSIDNKTSQSYLSHYPEIPWADIKGLSNIIAHEYHRIDEDEIFAIIKNDLPELLRVVRKMKAEL